MDCRGSDGPPLVRYRDRSRLPRSPRAWRGTFPDTAQGPLFNRPMELVAVHRDGHEFPVEATVWPVRVGGACSFNAFVRDISERRRAEEARKKETTLVQLLQSVTVAANRSSTIEQTAQTCLDRICSHTGWPVGHAYLRANDSPEELHFGGTLAPGRDGRFDAFREASDRCRSPSERDCPAAFWLPANPVDRRSGGRRTVNRSEPARRYRPDSGRDSDFRYWWKKRSSGFWSSFRCRRNSPTRNS